MKDKPTSIRLPNKTIEDIDNICDGIGCSRNEWIKDTLRDGVRRENSQDQEADADADADAEAEAVAKEEEVPKEVAELTNVRIVETPIDNSKKPIIEMVEFNGSYIPLAKVYET